MGCIGTNTKENKKKKRSKMKWEMLYNRKTIEKLLWMRLLNITPTRLTISIFASKRTN